MPCMDCSNACAVPCTLPVGGLLVSQVLTLYLTPVIYLYMDRLQQRFGRRAKVLPAQ